MEKLVQKFQPTGKLGEGPADQSLRSPGMQKPGGGKWMFTKLQSFEKILRMDKGYSAGYYSILVLT